MAAKTTPDPITESRAYQDHLLGLLGNEDPAAVQAATEPQVLAIVRQAGPDLRRKPAPNQWSILELVGHLLDAEIVLAGRYRWAVSHDRPNLLGYDQDRWVERLRHNEDEPDSLLQEFSSLRAANLRLWKKSSAEERSRVAMHAERGPESYDMMFRMLAGHDRFHLQQMRETLLRLRGQT